MKIKQLITLLVGAPLLLGCANIKEPFEIKKTIITEKTTSENNGKLIEVTIADNKNIKFLNMYYKNKKVPIKMIDKNTFTGFFKDNDIQQKSINIHINPIEEFGNRVGEIKVKPPIKFNENQILISYKLNKQIKYKVINISNN